MATAVAPTGATTAGVAPATPVQTDTVEGNEVPNRASLVLVLDNSAGEEASEVTFVTVATVGGYAVEDVSVTIPAGASRVFGHFPANIFGSTVQFSTSVAVDVVAYA